MDKLLSRLKDLYESRENIKILDIGGWFAPCKQANVIVDIMPFETINKKAA